jgi:hypothetical protein
VTVVKGAFPYDLDHLLGGRARVLIAKITSTPPAVPVKINDIIKLESPYEPLTGWTDIGAARDSASYNRGFSSEGWEVQQVNSRVLEDITDTSRSLSLSIAEVRSDLLELIEQSPGAETIAAVAGATPQKAVPVGNITDLTRYRVAFIAQRKKKSGIVKEKTGGRERGRFVAITINEATISADETGIEFDKGALSHVPLNFTAFPTPGEEEGEEFGRWILEDAATIA